MKQFIVYFAAASTALCFSLTCLNTPSAFAQPNEFKITPSDGAKEDRFGSAVDLSGDYAVIGAPLDDDARHNGGSAYIFKREGTEWIEQAKITAGDAGLEDRFGYSVAISGDYVIVGAPFDDNEGEDSGSAYIFKRDGADWLQQAKLTANDVEERDRFGYSVAIDGDYTIIGMPFDSNEAGGKAGSVYVFHRSGTTWTQQARLIANSDLTFKDEFGISVDIDGEYVIIGAHKDWVRGAASWLNAGSAYIFKRMETTWSQQAKLRASDAPAFDFGYTVSIDDDYAIIGAYSDDATGTAYIFKREGAIWAQESKLTARDGMTNDKFGFSVGINGDRALVGAYFADSDGSIAGSAYVFKRTASGWFQAAKLSASDAGTEDHFGYAVAISHKTILIGAPLYDDNEINSGSVHCYDSINFQCDDLSLPDTAAYGNIESGDQTHGDRISYCFAGQPGDMLLSFQAHAIDDGDEVDVVINGIWLFDVPATGNDRWSRDFQVFMPDSLLHDTFANSITFDNTKSSTQSSTWGIRHVTAEECFPLPVARAYGKLTKEDNTHVDKVAYCFPAQTENVILLFEAFDIDVGEDVEVRCNGTKIFAIPTTENDQWSTEIVLTLPDSLINDIGENLLVFDNTDNPPRNWTWGVRNVRISSTTTDIEQQQRSPRSSHLAQNFPNPFNPATTIRFELPQSGKVKLEIFNLQGTLVKILVDNKLSTGSHQVIFYASGLASGIYFYRLQAGHFTETRKMLLAQ